MSLFDTCDTDLWGSDDTPVIGGMSNDKPKRDRPQQLSQHDSDVERSFKSQKTELSPVVPSHISLPVFSHPSTLKHNSETSSGSGLSTSCCSSSSSSSGNSISNESISSHDFLFTDQPDQQEKEKQDHKLNKNTSNHSDGKSGSSNRATTSSMILMVDNFKDDTTTNNNEEEDDNIEDDEDDSENDLMKNRESYDDNENSDNEINPNSSTTPWSLEEDATLVETQAQVGNKWLYISQLLPGRTKAHCKVRFTSLIRASKKEWTSDNDSLLLDLFDKYKGDFKRMADHFPMRTKNAVKLRTRELQRNQKNKGKFKFPAHGSSKQLFFYNQQYLIKYFMNTGAHQSFPVVMDPPPKDGGAETNNGALNTLTTERYFKEQVINPHDTHNANIVQQGQTNIFISRNNQMLTRSPIERPPLNLPIKISGDNIHARSNSENVLKIDVHESPVQNKPQMLPPIPISRSTTHQRHHSDLPISRSIEQSPSDFQTKKAIEMYSPFQNSNQLASPMLSDLFSKTTLNTPRASAPLTTASSFVEMNPSNLQSNSSAGSTDLPPVSDFDAIAAELFCDGGFILDDNQFTTLLGDQ